MKISIIIPVYNLGHYLRQCLDSVLVQSYQELEIIIVNDGSSDDSVAVMDMYDDDRIIKVHIENQGVTAARKVGWQHSNGDYCLFVDGDDMLPVDAVSFFVEKIKEGGYDFVQGWYDLVDQDFVHESVIFPHKIGRFSAQQYIQNSLDAVADFQSIWIGIYKRSVITEKAFDVDRKFYRGEDSLTLLGILNNCDKILVTDKVFYHYYQRSDSVSHSRPIGLEYLYRYNIFRYTVLNSQLRPFIEINTLQRILPYYFRLLGTDIIRHSDVQLLEMLNINCRNKPKSLKLKIQLFCFEKPMLERIYKFLISFLKRS